MSKEYVIGAKDRSTAKKYVDYLERAVRNGGKVGESYSSGRRGNSNTNSSSSVDDYRGFYDFTFHALFDSSYNYVYSGINVAWKNYASIDDTVVGLYKKDGVVKKAKWDGNIFKLNDTYNQYYVYIDVDTGDIKVTNMERDEEKGSVLNGGKPCIVLFDFNVADVLSGNSFMPLYSSYRVGSYIDTNVPLYNDVRKANYYIPEYITENEYVPYTIGSREYVCVGSDYINYSKNLLDENGKPYDVLTGCRVIDVNNRRFLYPLYKGDTQISSVSYEVGSDYLISKMEAYVPAVRIVFDEALSDGVTDKSVFDIIKLYADMAYNNNTYNACIGHLVKYTSNANAARAEIDAKTDIISNIIEMWNNALSGCSYKYEEEAINAQFSNSLKKSLTDASAYLENLDALLYCSVINKAKIHEMSASFYYPISKLNEALYGLHKVTPYVKVFNWREAINPCGHHSYLLSGGAKNVGEPVELFNSGRFFNEIYLNLV